MRRIGGRGFLRMPLDTEHPGDLGFGAVGRVHVRDRQLDGLDQAVGASTAHEEALSEPVDALMMVRGAREWPGLGRGREQGPGFRRHGVERLGALDRHTVLEEAGQIGQVLQQRAPERDVHDLHAAADAQGGQVRAVRRVDERDLDLVTVRFDAVVVLGVGRGPVASGLDVTAAHQHQAVERFEEVVGVACFARRDDGGPRARPAQGIEVWSGNAVASLRPPSDPIVGQVIAHHGHQWPIRGAHDEIGSPAFAAATRTNRSNTSRPRCSCPA